MPTRLNRATTAALRRSAGLLSSAPMRLKCTWPEGPVIVARSRAGRGIAGKRGQRATNFVCALVLRQFRKARPTQVNANTPCNLTLTVENRHVIGGFIPPANLTDVKV